MKREIRLAQILIIFFGFSLAAMSSQVTWITMSGFFLMIVCILLFLILCRKMWGEEDGVRWMLTFLGVVFVALTKIVEVQIPSSEQYHVLYWILDISSNGMYAVMFISVLWKYPPLPWKSCK